MCLQVDSTYHPKDKPIIAKKNIYVYKEVHYYSNKNKNAPAYPWIMNGFNFEYIKGKINPVVDLVINSRGNIHEGYHSFPKYKGWMNALFMIPKGSSFYIGNERVNTDIVSNSIVYVRRIKYHRYHKMVLWLKSLHPGPFNNLPKGVF